MVWVMNLYIMVKSCYNGSVRSSQSGNVASKSYLQAKMDFCATSSKRNSKPSFTCTHNRMCAIVMNNSQSVCGNETLTWSPTLTPARSGMELGSTAETKIGCPTSHPPTTSKLSGELIPARSWEDKIANQLSIFYPEKPRNKWCIYSIFN